MLTLRAVAVAAFLGLALAACGDDGDSSEGNPSDGTEDVADAPDTSATTSAPPEPVTVMALGDSITEGPYYRAPLQALLTESGCEVDFVGTQIDQEPDQPGLFDPDHEGHGGFTADQLAAEAQEWAALEQPEIVLVYAGINDLYAGDDAATAADDVRVLVEAVRTGAPEAEILVGLIMPGDAVEESVSELNQRLSGLEPDVTVVDFESGFDPAADTVDGVHPTSEASRRIAAGWFAALEPLLGSSCTG